MLQAIQTEYGTFTNWIDLVSGKDTDGEPNAKAVVFVYTEMINEGIDIDNEENDTDIKPLSARAVGRMVTEMGLDAATEKMNEVVGASTQGGENSKNE